MYKWLYSISFWLFMGYCCWSQQIESQLFQINRHIQNGDYFRATNLCNSLLKQANLNEQDVKILKDKLDWIKYADDIEKQTFVLIRKRKYDDAIFTLKKVKQQGIYSTKNKDLMAILSNAKKYENTSTEQRYINKANEYIATGNIEKGKIILRLFPENPIAIIILKGLEAPQEAALLPTPCDDKGYTSLKKQMQAAYNECKLQEAKRIGKQILQLECYQKDRTTQRLLNDIAITQQQLRDIAEWKSGGDNSKREFIIPEYQKVFRKNRNCVEWDYFYYAYSSAEKMRADDPCSKNAVARYLQAKRISENLAGEEKIDQKIAAIDKCTDCDDKTALFVQITNEAQSLLNKCSYDEAKRRYKDATPYNCSEKTQSIAKKWNEELIPQIERNKTQANRFVALKASADSLAALGECQIALKLYQAADSIQLDCIKLNKQDIALKISKMQCCVDSEKFTGLRDTVRAALNEKIVLVKNNDFLNRRAICGKVVIAVLLAKNNKCIDSTKAKMLFELSCKTCAAEYPTFFKCPSPPSIAGDSVTKYQGLELIANAFYNNPAISSATRLTLPTWAWGGWGVGVNYVRSWGSFGEWKAGVMFSNNHFEVNQPFSDKENFDFQLLRLSTEFTWKPKKKINTYPFATIGLIVNIPLKFNYQAGNRMMNSTDLLATKIGLKTGLGFVIKRRVSVSISYDVIDLFQAKAAETPLLINKSRYQTIGFNLGYRFLKYRKVK